MQSAYYQTQADINAPHTNERFAVRAPIANSWTFRTSLLAPFKTEYEFAMVPDWDGPGTVALSSKVISIAEKIIESYSTLDQLVEVGASRSGSISFIWTDADEKYIYLDVGPNETVHLYYDVTGEKWEGVSVASDPRILGKISRAFARAGWSPQKIIHFAISGSRTSAGGGRWQIA
jgi:hypothetical protein